MQRASANCYGMAILVSLITLGVLSVVGRFIGATGTILLLFTPVIWSAWQGGLGPGLFSTAMAGLAGYYFAFLPVSAGFSLVPLCLFAAQGILVSALSETRRRALQAERLARKAAEEGALHSLAAERARQAALQERDARLHALFERAADAISISSSGEFRALNPAYASLLAYDSPEEMIGLPMEAVIAPSCRAHLKECAARLAPGMGESALSEYKGLRKDGVELDLEGHLSAYEFEGETFVVMTARDVTEHKRVETALRRSEELYRTLGEAVPDFVWACGPQGEPLYVNDRWTQYTGLTLEDAVKLPGDYLYHPEDYVRLVAMWETEAGKSERHDIEFRYRRHDGAYRWYLSRGVPVKDEHGQVTQWVGTTTDIHERKMQEEKIAALNIQLQRSMSETHHRVKNNLQIISALLDMQEMQYSDAVPVVELTRIRHHICALAAIHDLLTFQAKTDAAVHNISVKAAFEKLMPMIEAMVSRNRVIRFSVQDLQLPVRHSTTLVVIVNELVSNALKHGEGAIDVCFSVESESATLRVLDEGAGFPDAFDVETAAHTGLELVQSLSRWDLQGSIRFENREIRGACVVVAFPVPPTVRTPGEE